MASAHISQDAIPDLYRRLAPVYNVWARLTESRARQRCLELAGIGDGASILEVAVGTGLTFERILRANPGGRNEGVDLSDAMLGRAWARAAATGRMNYRLRIGDAHALDFPDHEFDVLINSYMFDLLPESDFPQVLDEFKRVLRPGGRLVITGMTIGRRWYHGFWEAVHRVNPAWMGGCRGVQMQPHLYNSGFALKQREFVSQLGFPSEVILATAPG
jgi:ubiquinone/menaquinone biosynthesis C-methylase UbiE